MQENKQKTALVVEGGAMRGIYATGVLDAFIEADYYDFDLCIGVSAGATNLASYLAGMHRRNYTVYTHYSLDKRFINLWKFLGGGHFMDLDWLWEVTVRELRLDLETLRARPARFLIGATESSTGQCVFMEPEIDTLVETLKASSALPVMYRKPVRIGSQDFWDGGVSEPIPVREAIRQGATRILVIRSRQDDYVMRQPKWDLSRWLLMRYPAMARAVSNRPRIYNDTLAFMREGGHGVEIEEICPPDAFETSRLTRDRAVLDKDYLLGVQDGRRWLARQGIKTGNGECEK